MTKKYDCSGYATKFDVRCGDGRTIRKGAFELNHGGTVPLVWQHDHNDPTNVLGYADLESRPDGVYARCAFNDSPNGRHVKGLVQHGDIVAFSIYANQLVQKGGDVIHGLIRELSLVMSGQNPGALIDNVIMHGDVDEDSDEAIIYSGELLHAEDMDEDDEDGDEGGDETVAEIFDSLSPKQKMVVYAIVGEAVNDARGGDSVEQSAIDEGDDTVMKKNAFDNESKTLVHGTKMPTPDQVQAVFAAAHRNKSSVRQEFIAHAGTYGIDNIDYLFPEAQNVTNEPIFITRDMSWVQKVLGKVKKSRFSRIKNVFADITADEARAKGYVTGALKTEEVFGLLRRSTGPTTFYKKQKLDRDDIIDITDFDVVTWLKKEMRVMLDEELARAILISDGRLIADPDKIDETCIRPIYKDDAAMYVHLLQLAYDDDYAEMMDKIILARIEYKGSGNPDMFVTPELLTNLLLQKDTLGHRLYKTEQELAAALRVNEIVEVPVMSSVNRTVETVQWDLKCIIVNLTDYTVGADRGGEVSFFDDFDIDYNQQKYLLEGRCSGALTMPKSAIVVEQRHTAP